MRVLVTGGAGFIGSHLVEALLGAGHEVVCVDNFDPFYDVAIKRGNIATLVGRDDFVLAEVDICDRTSMERVFADGRPELVIHLAAKAGVRPSLAEPILYHEVNTGGTLTLLELCRAHGVDRFIFGSTSSIYGVGSEVPFTEKDHSDQPASPYAATKRAAEILCFNYHHLYGLNVTALRFFTVYGPRQRPEMAIHKFVRMIDNGERIPLFGDGSSRRDYTYVSDIINGVVRATECVEGFEIVNIGGAQTITLLGLVELIEKAMGRKALVDFLPEQPGDMEATWADVAKAERMFGYRPGVAIEAGIPLFVEWYREQKRAGTL